jgi:type I restriction enzyme S subunit
MTEGPYKLPKGWRWVRLGEVAWRESVTLQLSARPDDVFYYIGMEHVAPGQWDEPTPVQLSGAEIKSQVIKYWPGLVLYGKLRPYLNKVVVPSREGVASTEFIPIAVNKDSLDPYYLGAYLRSPSFVAYASQNTTGSRQPRVRLDALWNALIPLPPLEEQRRIVARIEELMGRVREARRLREEARNDAERLWQAILAQTFPRPGSELPEGWRWVRLGEVAQIYAGSSAPQGEQYFRGGKWPFVRVQDLGRYGQTTCLKETANYVNEYALQKYRLRLAKAGTILFPKSGAAILTNSRAILGVDAYIVSHLAAVEPLPDKLDTYWAYFWLCTMDMKEFIDNPSYPSLRLSEVSKLLIPLPPLEEQRRIVAHLQEVQEKIKALKEAQEQTEAELKRLEQAILDKAFRGEL